jgi:hypothetical protein
MKQQLKQRVYNWTWAGAVVLAGTLLAYQGHITQQNILKEHEEQRVRRRTIEALEQQVSAFAGISADSVYYDFGERIALTDLDLDGRYDLREVTGQTPGAYWAQLRQRAIYKFEDRVNKRVDNSGYLMQQDPLGRLEVLTDAEFDSALTGAR